MKTVVRLRRRLAYANVIVTLALFFGLTGGSMACVKYVVATDTIPTTSDLAGSTYGNPMIAAFKVTTAKIADGAVTSSKFDGSALAPNSARLNGLVPSFADTGATAIAVRATRSRAVYGSDGREHIDYDLVITNAFTGPVRLESLRVRGGGKTLLTLTGSALAAKTFQNWLTASTPTAVIPIGSTVASFIDVALPRSMGRTPPKRLTNLLRYSLPPTAPVASVIGSKVVRLPVRTDPIRPLLIRSPLRGSGWFAANGCCADPTSPHRKILVPANGAYATPEIFAIDWIRVVNTLYFKGDGSKNTDWPAYGAPVHGRHGGQQPTPDRAVHHEPQPPQARGLRGQQRRREDRPAPVRDLRAHAAWLGPGQGGPTAEDRPADRAAGQLRKHDGAPPALRDLRRPRPGELQQRPLRDQAIPVPGERGWDHARSNLPHRQAAPRTPLGAADRLGGDVPVIPRV
jgi:hypothetical protein